MAAIRSVTKGRHKWPESIDFDRSGNLYFSDHLEKALFRIRRNQDGTLADASERILYGFKHASGVSIDREKNLLYLGARVKRNGKVIRVPLELFDQHSNMSYSSFREEIQANPSFQPSDFDLGSASAEAKSPKPNGIAFDQDTDTIFYTHSEIEWTWLGIQGFLGNSKGLVLQEFSAPNGIDTDPTEKGVLVVSLFWNNLITRLDWASGTEIRSPSFGRGPDGLLCLENGDVLVASYRSREVTHLSWNGKEYGFPTVIHSLSDCPTDVAIGPSSGGNGESLFVTTTKGLLCSFLGGGDIIEILNIRELIGSK